MRYDGAMFVAAYIIALILFCVIDLLWIGVIAKSFYRKYLGYIMAERVNWFAAVVFYLLFVFGLVFFVIQPAFTAGLGLRAAGYGALFGLVSYATYDLTNHATVRNWPKIITIADMAWGAFTGAVVSGLTYIVVTTFFVR